MGYRLRENFRRPYFAINPSEFWEKWHISLSSWLRDYLYISLGGNRGGKFNTYRNLMLTMLLGGLWHGANWNFVLWGFMHGLILIIYRVFADIPFFIKIAHYKLSKLISLIFFQWFVLMTWVAFRLTDTDKMITTFKKMLFFDFNFSVSGMGLGVMETFSTFFILATFWLIHVYSNYRKDTLNIFIEASLPKKMLFGIITGFILFYFWPLSESPFIYFQF